MKKTYIKPIAETVDIETEQLLDASEISFNGNSGMASLNDDYAEGEAMSNSRGQGIWDSIW